jgi:glycogen debranching enzyme
MTIDHSQTAAGAAVDDEMPPPYEAVNPNHPRLAIKHRKYFLLMDTEGMVPGNNKEGFGFFADDTRWLSKWDISLGNMPLLPLNRDVDEGFAARFIYGNRRFDCVGNDGTAQTADKRTVPEQTIKVERELVLNDGLIERLTLTNYSQSEIRTDLSITVGSDFADMFEVRGANRPKRGTSRRPILRGNRLTLGYVGLDNTLRETSVLVRSKSPVKLEERALKLPLVLKAGEPTIIEFVVRVRVNGKFDNQRSPRSFAREIASARRAYDSFVAASGSITTENPQFNAIFQRALRDIYILRQESPRGNTICAGVPWFAVPFGRDSAITALQTVPFLPELSRDVLRVLAAYQGEKHDPVTAEEAGKIMHELRVGEMAVLKEVAFRPYYGTVDATQLWLMLLAEYVRWTGDVALARELWPNVMRALSFLNDATAKDGFIRYGGVAGEALSNQGWKDSGNSIVFKDGTLGKAPIAVCEAQGYLYSAWKGTAFVARLLGKWSLSFRLGLKSEHLRALFQKHFWMPSEQYVALALDGENRQCDAISSNPGHLLGSGILTPEQEHLVADRLMAPDMFCGWGIRTLSSSERAYQPMDYQVGSVWPHDNGFAIEGLAKLGRNADAHRVFEGLVGAAAAQSDWRLPELFAGFDRSGHKEPVRYPVACVPQAWAAGSVFQIIKACLNMKPDAKEGSIDCADAVLPSWLGQVVVKRIQVGGKTVDLQLPLN